MRKTFGNLPVRARQKGVSLVLVLGILGLISMATWLLSSRSEGGTNSINDAAANSAATAVIAQANALYGGYQQAALNGVSPASVTLDTTAGTGIYHPDVGGVPSQAPVARAFSGAPASWTTISATFPGAGTSAADQILTLRGVRSEVCAAIVKSFQGTSATTPTTATDLANAADLSAVTALTNQLTGCVSYSGTHIAYVVVSSK